MKTYPKDFQEFFTIEELNFSLRNEILGTRPAQKGDLGLVLDGTVLLEYMDENGLRRIVDFYNAGDYFFLKPSLFFGKADFCTLARSKCKIAFFYRKKNALGSCEELPSVFYESIYPSLQSSALAHINILQQPSLRRKIFSFLQYYSQRCHRNPFSLTLSFTDCADFLAVDRSAMMRELGRMEKEGLLQHKGRNVSLLQPLN